MTASESSVPHVSLNQAAISLHAAIESRETGDTWRNGARSAIRLAIMAVEHHLDALLARDGLAEDITAEAPRLIPAVERLEATLAKTLVRLWEAQGAEMDMDPALPSALAHIAHQVDHLANEEIELFYESMTPAVGLD